MDYVIKPGFERPGLTWDAKLNVAKVVIELILDPDIYIFLEKRMGIGIFCSF